jgi:DNA-directed RNA polymerase subunit RPC12/RpoP
MSDVDKQRWRNLCERAVSERNPRKLGKIIQEINKLIEEKKPDLTSKPPEPRTLVGSHAPWSDRTAEYLHLLVYKCANCGAPVTRTVASDDLELSDAAMKDADDAEVWCESVGCGWHGRAGELEFIEKSRGEWNTPKQKGAS